MSLVARLLTVLALLSTVTAGWAAADQVATVRTQTLPTLQADEPVQDLVTADGRLLAVGSSKTWLLSADGSSWGAPQPRPAGLALLGGPLPEPVETLARLQVAGDNVSYQALPPLPLRLHKAQAATLPDALYVAGLDPQEQPRLYKLPSGEARPAWQVLQAWPEGGEPLALVGQTRALFLTLAGRQLRWAADQGWSSLPAPDAPVMPGSGRPVGQAHVLYLAGQPGQPRQMLSFHTITGSWAVMRSDLPSDARQPAAWKNGLAWLQGAGERGAQSVAGAEVEAGKLMLRWLDWLVIVVYLIAMLGMGLYFYLREKRNSTSDFFVGGRSIPFWAAGVSLYAANTSSISYIAIPAKAFETNWQYLTNNLIAVLGLMFVAVWIVPLLRRLDLMSVFSYLETRFHPAIRMLSSALCILVQLGSRMSVILFLPSLAIATITGIDMVWSILLMGGFTIAYTALGGMKAVVWTDIVQLVVKMGGAVFAIGFVIWHLDGGLSQMMHEAAAAQKTKMFDFSFDLTKATVWGFIFLVLFDVVLTFPKDQVLMQRTLSTKNDRDAGRSIWAFAAIMIPGGFVFYAIGTALYVYYKANPERMNPLLSIDATFPMFIAAELPMGVTGLIIAGIFAAAMATLSSIINSVATLASVDFYEKLVKNPDPKKSVLFAELMTVAAGLIGVGFALLLSRYDIHSLFDVSIELAGLLGGGFAGAYTLGMFTRRANAPGVAIGVGSAILLTTLAWWMKLVHPYFYLAISILLCIVIGYLASLLFPPPRQSLKGLTIYRDD
ncbi:sodium:solute symporter family transporter [Roseateles sp.]|uniref:sodium:solute symporter n=1 Tax=Roseateles sp. TaxID=1971397 RepID=UPI0039E8CB8F